jgi:hypothetical protein
VACRKTSTQWLHDMQEDVQAAAIWDAGRQARSGDMACRRTRKQWLYGMQEDKHTVAA